jgi:serine/threonine protein kinase
MQLIDILQVLHDKGIIHSDLNPEKIMTGSKDPTNPKSSIIYLVDFEVCQRYLTLYGDHFERKDLEFMGTLLFSSPNVFRYICKSSSTLSSKTELSRRDDILSLAFILCYLVTGKISWLPKMEKKDPDYNEKLG